MLFSNEENRFSKNVEARQCKKTSGMVFIVVIDIKKFTEPFTETVSCK